MPPIALISAAEPEEANLLPDASVKFLPYPIDRANVTKRNWKLSEVSLPRIVGMSPTRARIDQSSLGEKITHLSIVKKLGESRTPSPFVVVREKGTFGADERTGIKAGRKGPVLLALAVKKAVG